MMLALRGGGGRRRVEWIKNFFRCWERGVGGGCCSFRPPYLFFNLKKCKKEHARTSTDFFKPVCHQVVTLPSTMNYIRHESFVFHVFRVSVWHPKLAKHFFLLWTIIWLYETFDIIFLSQQLKFQPIRNHDEMIRHTAVWIARARMTKYGHAISRQKNNFPVERNVCFDTFWKSTEVFSVK